MNWHIPHMGYQENFLLAEQQKLGHEVFIVTSDRIPLFKGFENTFWCISNDRIVSKGKFEEKGVTIFRLSRIFEIRDGGIIASYQGNFLIGENN